MKGLSCNSNLLSLGGLNLEHSFALLAEIGYQAIDISLEISGPFEPMPAPHMSPRAKPSERRKVLRWSERTGVEIAALNGHTNLIHGVERARKANFRHVKGVLELASDLRAKYVIVGGGRKEFYGRESQYWEWLVTALRELAAHGEKLGVTLAIEAGSFPGSLVHNQSRLQKLLSYEGLSGLGVLYDPSHFHVRGDAEVNVYRALQSKIVHVHLKDARGNQEDFEFPPLGAGDVDFAALLDAVRATDYQGYLSVEYEGFAWGYESDARKVLTQSKAFVDQLLSRQNTVK